jgi:putative acetyltransferase
MHIREAVETDLNQVLSIERLAFGCEKEADLVRELLRDPSAEPLISLLAFDKERAVGHILFTTAHLSSPQDAPAIVILAPLAIVPDCQKKGIGGKLIENGLALLSKSGVDLVFVLGHPEYYPRHGFTPAGHLGFEAPYPIPDRHAGAWMVQALRPGVMGTVSGKVICADALNQPEHWRE